MASDERRFPWLWLAMLVLTMLLFWALPFLLRDHPARVQFQPVPVGAE